MYNIEVDTVGTQKMAINTYMYVPVTKEASKIRPMTLAAY